jgi:undecaprenyl-diphosphatase
MTTFQAIIYAIIHGFSTFLPIGAEAHHSALAYFFGWQLPTGPFLGALSLGALLALLVYFRHDWASMISSILQVILFRKKPMTLDERMPFFIVIASIPGAAAWYYTSRYPSPIELTPLLLAGGLALFSVPLGFSDFMSRRNKNMYDWNWLDSLWVGICEALVFIPGVGRGCGRATGALTGGLLRNYSREAAAKFMLFAGLPAIVAATIGGLHGMHLHDAMPMPQVSWFTFCVTVLVSLFASLLAIGGLMKHVQRKGFSGYVIYRLLLAVAIVVVYWTRNRA